MRTLTTAAALAVMSGSAQGAFSVDAVTGSLFAAATYYENTDNNREFSDVFDLAIRDEGGLPSVGSAPIGDGIDFGTGRSSATMGRNATTLVAGVGAEQQSAGTNYFDNGSKWTGSRSMAESELFLTFRVPAATAFSLAFDALIEGEGGWDGLFEVELSPESGPMVFGMDYTASTSGSYDGVLDAGLYTLRIFASASHGFGDDASMGSASLDATVTFVPAPAGLFALAGLAALRRRR